MRALCWHGEEDVRVDTVPDPEIVNPHDAVIEITATAICGSDLHLYNGYVPTMQEGDVLGHEPMGEVIEVGSEVENLEEGDRVVVPFTISCGSCWFCEESLYSLSDNSNPNAEIASKTMGHSPAGLFGYSHMMGGYAGAQAEYLRVPFADVGPIKVDSDLSDERVLLLSRVVAIDHVPERLQLAREHGEADTIDFEDEDVYDRLMEMTGGRGPDRCIDAVGTEAHGTGLTGVSDRVKQEMHLGADRPHVLRQAIKCCRKGGTLSVPGVYLGHVDNFPVGSVMNKALTVKTGQTHVQRYLAPLLERIENGDIDPSFVVTHNAPLEKGPEMYETFRNKEDGCIKVVLTP